MHGVRIAVRFDAAGGVTRMKAMSCSGLLLAAVATTLSGCTTLQNGPDRIFGTWGGAHVGLSFEGGLADVQFDCAAGTIDDPVYPGPDGSFTAKGTYRTGALGPVKVGQFFKSQDAVYSGRSSKVAAKSGPRTMVLRVALEDGTTLGPFTLTEGAPPQLTRCA
jgi:hypothetical protein